MIIERSWSRIDQWLEQHAPKTFNTLEPPITDQEISHAEQLLGHSLPPEILASLKCHNGVRDEPNCLTLPGDYSPTSAKIIAEDWRKLNSQLHDLPEYMVGIWWHPQWAPFARSGGTDCLIQDLRPSPDQGRIGTFLSHDRTYFETWPSFAAMLEDIAQTLETGGESDGYTPGIEDGCLTWTRRRT